jgi:hypothetical protein
VNGLQGGPRKKLRPATRSAIFDPACQRVILG